MTEDDELEVEVDVRELEMESLDARMIRMECMKIATTYDLTEDQAIFYARQISDFVMSGKVPSQLIHLEEVRDHLEKRMKEDKCQTTKPTSSTSPESP